MSAQNICIIKYSHCLETADCQGILSRWKEIVPSHTLNIPVLLLLMNGEDVHMACDSDINVGQILIDCVDATEVILKYCILACICSVRHGEQPLFGPKVILKSVVTQCESCLGISPTPTFILIYLETLCTYRKRPNKCPGIY